MIKIEGIIGIGLAPGEGVFMDKSISESKVSLACALTPFKQQVVLGEPAVWTWGANNSSTGFESIVWQIKNTYPFITGGPTIAEKTMQLPPASDVQLTNDAWIPTGRGSFMIFHSIMHGNRRLETSGETFVDVV